MLVIGRHLAYADKSDGVRYGLDVRLREVECLAGDEGGKSAEDGRMLVRVSRATCEC